MEIRSLLAEYDSLRGTLDDAALLDWLRDACARYDAAQPEDYRGRSALYNELGNYFMARNRLEEGEAAFLEAKALLEVMRFVKDPEAEACADCIRPTDNVLCLDETGSADYATVLNNLAGLYRLQQRYEEAVALFSTAAEIYALNPETPRDIAASCGNNLGLVYLERQEDERALAAFEAAAAMLSEREAEALGATLCNLSVALLRLNRHEECRARLTEAVGLLRGCVGEEDPRVQGCLLLLRKLEG